MAAILLSFKQINAAVLTPSSHGAYFMGVKL